MIKSGDLTVELKNVDIEPGDNQNDKHRSTISHGLNMDLPTNQSNVFSSQAMMKSQKLSRVFSSTGSQSGISSINNKQKAIRQNRRRVETATGK